MPKKSRIQEEYEKLYLRLSDLERRNYWVQMGNLPRSEYQKLEHHLQKVANPEMAMRILFRPS